jgi:toxin ParE1/3/4
MSRYYLTNKAVEDLSGIWDYTFEEWSERQADKYYQELIEKFKEIEEDPEVGKNYEGIHPDLYGLKVTRHILFYRIIGKDKIEITRILHERMDLKSRIID